MEKEADPAVISAFRKRRNRQLIALFPIIIALILIVMTEESSGFLGVPPNIITPIAIAILIIVLAFSWFNWRCPVCKAYLGKGFSPKFCIKCGARLQK